MTVVKFYMTWQSTLAIFSTIVTWRTLQKRLVTSKKVSCSCHEHTTNLATGVSRQPALDCGTIFHPDCGSRDFPSILSDDL